MGWTCSVASDDLHVERQCFFNIFKTTLTAGEIESERERERDIYREKDREMRRKREKDGAGKQRERRYQTECKKIRFNNIHNW